MSELHVDHNLSGVELTPDYLSMVEAWLALEGLHNVHATSAGRVLGETPADDLLVLRLDDDTKCGHILTLPLPPESPLL